MNYYTLTAEMEEESDSDDPSWLLTTSENTKNKVQQENYVQASAVHGQINTVQESTSVHKPTESKLLEDAVRNYISPQTYQDLLNSAARNPPKCSDQNPPKYSDKTPQNLSRNTLQHSDPETPVVLRNRPRRKTTSNSGGRRASQRFSRLLEGVASYVIGSNSTEPIHQQQIIHSNGSQSIHNRLSEAETKQSSISFLPYIFESKNPQRTRENPQNGHRQNGAGQDDEFDSVPCWDPHFTDGSRNLKTENLEVKFRKHSQQLLNTGSKDLLDHRAGAKEVSDRRVGANEVQHRRTGAKDALDRRQSVPYWVEANIQELHSKESLFNSSHRTDEISERINEIFASFGLDETKEHCLQKNPPEREEKGYFQRRKNVVSGYFFDLANNFG
ncbi:uncharacterized protein LOC111710532 isoform X2 [Eurytemora carolleeae]|uniref:uncharacterized protein LOC111710532 isoform X2 n=1 Tax=Eurytemora carolleeae TaxID=1294199 RepID=UPI000C756440|nr:uncharacterized protein LOC111710532 isoform X2 [Eurytemora carolleeae]|eukprot:XP_023340403.1 uncharacterized protein LOC111710532 isoform X2 [Eurytemora affinis]